MRRSPILFLLPLLLLSQLVFLRRPYYSSTPEVVIQHQVMLENFQPCVLYKWEKSNDWSSTEKYLCVDNGQEHGVVYKTNYQWHAFGWGIAGQDFKNSDKAKQYIEWQTGYWMRPMLEIPE